MKRLIALVLALTCAFSLVGCNYLSNETDTDTVQFHDKTFNKSDLSQETTDWLEWYNSLTEKEQLSISSIPPELYELCGYSQAENTEAIGPDNK